MSADKCSVRDGKFVEPCSFLKATTEYGPPRGKGIFAHALTSLQTRKPTRTFYGVRSGERTAKGVALNYCPFCGERIDAPFAEPEAS